MLNTKKIKLDFIRTKIFIPVLLVLTHCMAIQVPEDYVTDLYYADQPKVMSLTPSTSMSWTTLSTPVKMNFNNPMDASTITINTADTTCSGSIQITLATDNFATCLQFSSLSAETRNSVFSAALAADLDPNSDYIIKIAGSITDFRGKNLGADATYPFKSGVPSGAEPYVVSVTPSGGFGTSLDFVVVFSRPIVETSIGTLAQNSCADTIILSADNFVASCNPSFNGITPGALVNGATTTYTINYKALAAGTYVFKIKKSLIDKFGIATIADYSVNYP